MGPIVDENVSTQHRYQFPLSPPPSISATALSSPTTGPLQDGSANKQPVYRRSASHSVHWSNTTHGDPLVATELHGLDSSPRKRPGTSHSSRSLTMPSASRTASECTFTLNPQKASSLSRSSSSRSSLSSASIARSQSRPHPASSTTAGIGRKVAASLQLFKESAPRSPSDEKLNFPKTDKLLGKRRPSSSHKNENVSEAKYEFVKRTDWPDPETAALRRERSSTALERIRTRESIGSQSVKDQESSRARDTRDYTRDTVMHDLSEWRKDVSKQETIRGRRRERASEVSVFDFDLDSPRAEPPVRIPSPYIRPHSRGYPPSPSPSQSPTRRVPPLTLYNIASDFNSPSARNGRKHDELRRPHSISSDSLRSRSPTPIHTSPYVSASHPSEVRRPYSPWSTDDESAWETTSITTDASTTAGTSEHPSPFRDIAFPPSYPAAASDEESDRSAPEVLGGGRSPLASDTWTEKHLDMTFGASDESLPHIPLRPFRNQVGGHSAIYKFTKRAVCKPLVSRENQFYEAVEREAPPLLGFIPRYLGVMLVTYRRVFKGSLTPTLSETPTPHPSSTHQPRPGFHKYPSHPALGPTSLSSRLLEEELMLDYESSEEMPEVVLDRNRHIVPEWVLRLGGRKHDRSISHSHSPPYHGSLDTARHLKSMCAMTVSTPDLMRREPSGTSMQCSPLTRQDTIPLEEGEAPTPSNSPERPAGVLQSSSFSDSRSARHILTTEDSRRPDLRLFHSEMTIGQTPSWFGGTGSTMVNTKLKDHVFNTILRRFQRQSHGKWSSSMSKIDDEGEMADREDRLICSARQARSHHRKRPVGQSESVVKEKKRIPRSPSIIRRVQSESAMDSKDAQEWACEMGYDTLQDIMNQPQGFDQNQIGIPSSIMRHRSRSRSVDFPVPPIRRSSEPSAPVPSKPSSLINSDDSITRQNHFIFMEDLTGRLKRSCVLDLKMGTRQYGMDATLAKKKSQRKKCDHTTSRPLGIRVCGMQVWNNATQTYVTQDKYMGRDVKPEAFESVLASFLHDGERLLVWQIPILLQKLYALARIINRLKGFRFYGCSLLLIYDGDREAQEAFRTCALEHPSSRSKRGESLERSRARSNNRNDRPLLRRSHSEDLLVGPVGKRSGGKRKRGEVNVRIVDFAHTTTGRDWLPHPPPPNRDVIQQVSSSKGYQAEVDAETGLIYARFPPHYPEEPDRGFLFGLKNLAETLENIWNEERICRIKLSRDDPSAITSQLPPLPSDGKEIFDEIFGWLEPDEDPGMLST